MPTLLPRWFTGMASIINIPILRPSLYRHEVGNHIKFTRLHLGSLALRPISLSFRNSRPLITQTPLLRTTKAYGQLLGRDFNPLAKLLLLRTSEPFILRPLLLPSCNANAITAASPESREFCSSTGILTGSFCLEYKRGTSPITYFVPYYVFVVRRCGFGGGLSTKPLVWQFQYLCVINHSPIIASFPV